MKNLVVAISGASGAIYAKRALEFLAKLDDVKTHLIISQSAYITIKQELDIAAKELESLADYVYPSKDISACLASGSFKVDGMLILPCSVKTMSNLATGNCANLITRTADVMLKERKALLLAVREAPLHAIHLENMQKLAAIGAYIFPPVPAFYHKPESLEEMVDDTVLRMLSYFGLEFAEFKSWQGIKS